MPNTRHDARQATRRREDVYKGGKRKREAGGKRKAGRKGRRELRRKEGMEEGWKEYSGKIIKKFQRYSKFLREF